MGLRVRVHVDMVDGFCYNSDSTEDLIMCLHIKSGPYVAKVDKTVYKIILMDNRSFYRNKRYKPNTLSPKVTLGVSLYGDAIKEGYHAFTNKRATVKQLQYYIGCKMVEFTIPAGSIYYIGNGDIVATRIRSGSLRNMMLDLS